jgi:hypothetical protein
MSRKLLYISGLLACYRCHMDYSDVERLRVYSDPAMRNEVIEHLQAIFRDAPLAIVAGVLLRYPHLDGSAQKILGSYNEFVGMLADEQRRKQLEDLKEGDAGISEGPRTQPRFPRWRAGALFRRG